MNMQSNNPSSSSSKGQSSQTWLTVLIGIAAIAGAAIFYTTNFGGKNVEQVAEGQLQALRAKDLSKAYYDFTSSEFQTDTSLEGFKEFVKTYPVLNDNKTAKFYDKSVTDTKASLFGTLYSQDDSSIPVVYRLVKQNGDWKIQNIELQDKGALRFSIDNDQIAQADFQIQQASAQPSDLTENLKRVIQGQLDTLKSKNIDKAYQDYVSPEFSQATSLAAFKEFVSANKILTGFENAKFGDGKQKGNEARISVTLSANNVIYPIEYTLIQKNGEWKIEGLKLLAPSNSGKPVSAEEKTQLTGIIQKQLDDLRSNNTEKAYDSVSGEFRNATSLDKFKEFVSVYPELTQYQSVKFGDATQEGDLRLVKVILGTSKGDSNVDYRLINDGSGWKIWGINIVNTPNHPPITADDKNDVSRVIDDQLKALKDKDLSKAYYPLTSRDFEKATTFDQFVDFINTYHIFNDYTSYKIIDAVQEGDLRLVRVALNIDTNVTEVDYRLVQEDGKWKIWGIQILTEPSTVKTAPRNKEDLLRTIQDQLNAIKSGDVSRAYYAFTSKEFQDAATRDVFKKFIDNHPALINFKNVTLNTVNYDKDMANATATLTTNNDQKYDLDYRLVFENDKWKIFSVQFAANSDNNATSDAATKSPLEFSKAILGKKVDLKGLIIDPISTFKPDDGDITVNLYVDNGTAGNVVEVVLEHVESSSTIPPVKATLDKSGDSVVSFVFTPPTQGWPVGNYKLHVSSSTGVEKVFAFKVQ
jgi:hypothetical protein